MGDVLLRNFCSSLRARVGRQSKAAAREEFRQELLGCGFDGQYDQATPATEFSCSTKLKVSRLHLKTAAELRCCIESSSRKAGGCPVPEALRKLVDCIQFVLASIQYTYRGHIGKRFSYRRIAGKGEDHPEIFGQRFYCRSLARAR